MKTFNTWLTVAIAGAGVAQAIFAGFLWRLQHELSEERRRGFVAVALEVPTVWAKAAVRFENASSSGVLLRYLNLVASAKGRTADAMKVDYRLSIAAHGSREKDITAEIIEAARTVDDADPAWTSGERLTVSVELEPHFTTIEGKKRKGPRVTYKVEFADGAIQSCNICEENED